MLDTGVVEASGYWEGADISFNNKGHVSPENFENKIFFIANKINNNNWW